MLSTLSIKNIALIDDLSIELKSGLNVLTGETGAGKSLVIDSISLLLGERADKSLISHGKDFAYVEAVFQNVSIDVKNKLEEFGLDREDTVIITRKITNEGKNDCRVNGKAFTLSMLKQISVHLMDLHGQFEHQSLLDTGNHIKVLDSYNTAAIFPYLIEFRHILNMLRDVKSELGSYNFDAAERAKLLELYAYQINEIESADFKEGEEEELKEFRVRVLSQEKLQLSIKRALELSLGGGYGGSSLSDMVGKISSEVASVIPYYKEIEGLSSRLDGIKFELIDIIDCLENVQDSLYFNEFEAEANEKRLDLLSSFKKKYGNNITEINEYLQKIKLEYKKLDNAEQVLSELMQRKQALEEKLLSVGRALTNERKKVAKVFEQKMTDELVSLGMKDAKFKVQFLERELSAAQVDGLDKVEFLFTANVGQPLRPLSKVASGGEMSRLMLSIKNAGGDNVSAGTMIFDEIDTGVSGAIARVIAEKLLSISKDHQVICVTHLAQIASYGQAHFFIQKSTSNNQTHTTIREIMGNERVNEIARIIGGNTTQSLLDHAANMINEGKEFSLKL